MAFRNLYKARMAPLRSPVPLEDIEPAARPVDVAVGLPPAFYTDAGFYRFEKAAVFDTEWLCVARSSQIPEPGDYFKPPRRRAIDELYAGPGEPDLNSGELLTVLEVPAAARARPAAFEKLRLYAGDFAVCSTAVSLELDTDGVTIVDARVSLGAVAPKPYRAKRSEKRLIGASLDDSEALREASWAWATDTRPLLGNAWKIEATCGLLLRALNRAASIASDQRGLRE